ncbi:DUF3489 domain-containing protein [Nordella sp. HKS 07]|uniref:DUF3489 domain-containing protein n=1 Tax=Nordella sp. HKS 07 TaxID=2712222 RepID=UPI001FEEB419|nr:DUF3489 domain-containing protein [Nordella sp. HKS 07]
MTKISKSSKNAVASTKAQKIISLLQRNAGATIAELSKATGWQAHSVRGFLSGTLKKRGFQIKSSQKEGKPRRYVIAGGDQ